MGDVQLITLNARGLREPLKRRALFRHLHVMYPQHIVCLQETHSVFEDEQIWRNEWGAQLFLSHGQSANQGGVAVLLPTRFSGSAKLVDTERMERMVMLQLEHL